MRILIVEDEKKVASFLERGLREERFAVDVAADGEQALERALAVPYDVILLDVRLPGRSGFDVLRELRAARCRSRVLMLTARDGVDDRVRGLEGGAYDYLTKPFAFAELLARVRSLLRRDAAEDPLTFTAADLVLNVKTHTVERAGRLLTLTPREFGVLEYLLRHPGQVISRTRLSEHVWDENFDPMSNVIDVTVHHLREKVDRDFKPPLIHTVRGVGYVLREAT